MLPQSADVSALLAQLAERRPKRIDLGLTRITNALARLGNPHEKLPPIIHVAGTNGKGSTIAYMHAILQQAGLSVHVYTSPHLVRFNERIIINNQEISDDELARVLGKCEAAAGDQELTYFEAVTCAAFLAFAQTPADILILEVGLGGRLDTTNVIETPRAAVITPIGLDHQDYLGETLSEIAVEKAGIIKAGCPVIIGLQHKDCLTVLEDRALALGAEALITGQDWHTQYEQGRLVYQDDHSLSDLSPPLMIGAHQIENAGLAVATLKAIGLAPDDEKISAGLEAAFWPARLQRLKHGPLMELARRKAHEDVEIWLDGGHNPHAAQVLARTMADLEERQSRPLILICGMQSSKDAMGFFTPFTDLASAVFTIQADLDSAAPAETLAKAAQRAGLPATPCPDVTEALRAALETAFNAGEGTPRIFICGSLYLAGEILKENN